MYTLAIDMGATSIRGVIGCLDNNNKLFTKEVLRFSHERIKDSGHVYWDWKKIIGNIENVICEYGEELDSIGIDTWGVDFGILDAHGDLIENPISYRDPSHETGYEIGKQDMGLENIFMDTGNQIMPINTLFQILSLKNSHPEKYEKIDKILMLPDLINYFLTNNKKTEETIISTSQLYNLDKNIFSSKVLGDFHISSKLFSQIIGQGEVVGSTKNSKIESLRKFDIPVISICSHDTASAVLFTESYNDPETLFVSCGTWSLIGCITENPVITKEVFKNSLTNEKGYMGSNMFFKNINGLYIFEKLKSQLEEMLERTIDFNEINNYIGENKDLIESLDIINVEDPIFAKDELNVIREINKILGKTQEHYYDYFILLYKSLAVKYKEVIKIQEEIIKRKFKKIHLIGGGSNSRILSQMICDYTGLEVIGGPTESTVYGNLLVQLVAQKKIGNIKEGIEIIKKDMDFKFYKPNKI